jgi:nucleotidyltransferase substrate binding protein (TIGR01987 family)
MAYTKEKLKQLLKALKSWEKALAEPYSDISRDASIQRYEFSFELLWKTIKIFLKENEGIECQSPKSCFRETRKHFGLTEKEVELCLQMTMDRNTSVHIYSEKLAKALYKRLKPYLEIAKKISKNITGKL